MHHIDITPEHYTIKHHQVIKKCIFTLRLFSYEIVRKEMKRDNS